MPKFYMIFARKINNPKVYMILARKMPKFYMIIAGKIFLPNLAGARALPAPSS